MVALLAVMPLHQGGEEGDRPGERRSGGVAASGGGQDQGVPGGHDDDVMMIVMIMMVMSGEDEADPGAGEPPAGCEQGLPPPAGAGPRQQGPRHQHRPHRPPGENILT